MQNFFFNRPESSDRSYCRAFRGTFAGARGTEIRGSDGRRYLDFLAGGGSLNYGHNHPVLKRELQQHMASDPIAQGVDMHRIVEARLIEAMREYLFEPHGLEYRVQFIGPTGANALETAMMLARHYTSRRNIVCFTNGFDGMSLGTMSVASNRSIRSGKDTKRARSDTPLTATSTLPTNDGNATEGVDALETFAQLLDAASDKQDLPAAVVVETVQGEGGLLAASSDWLRRLESLCRTHGILLIVDDIQAGCGRTGQFFSFDTSGVEPDLVTLSRSFSGFGLPLSLVLIRPEIDIWQAEEHNTTLRGNDHAFVTAAAAIEHFWSNDSFSQSIDKRARQLETRLLELQKGYASHLLALRGRGMMRGIVCADPAAAARVTRTAFERGLIIERAGPRKEVIKCLMPLTVSGTELDEGLDILASACDTVFSGDKPPVRCSRLATGVAA